MLIHSGLSLWLQTCILITGCDITGTNTNAHRFVGRKNWFMFRSHFVEWLIARNNHGGGALLFGEEAQLNQLIILASLPRWRIEFGFSVSKNNLRRFRNYLVLLRSNLVGFVKCGMHFVKDQLSWMFPHSVKTVSSAYDWPPVISFFLADLSIHHFAPAEGGENRCFSYMVQQHHKHTVPIPYSVVFWSFGA